MNCKPGDLAVIICSGAGNEGKIVEILRPASGSESIPFSHHSQGFHWWIRSCGSPIKSLFSGSRKETVYPDAWLRPIRPGDLEDETPTVRELEAA